MKHTNALIKFTNFLVLKTNICINSQLNSIRLITWKIKNKKNRIKSNINR